VLLLFVFFFIFLPAAATALPQHRSW